MGGYSCATDPSQPIIVHMVHVPSIPDAADPRSALKAARKTLFSKKFEDFERNIKADLSRILGSGFDPEKDIAAITVNRWSHGYAYNANTLAEPEEESEKIQQRARKPVGNITIAAADSGWSAYAHCAFDQAHRAVQEL